MIWALWVRVAPILFVLSCRLKAQQLLAFDTGTCGLVDGSAVCWGGSKQVHRGASGFCTYAGPVGRMNFSQFSIGRQDYKGLSDKAACVVTSPSRQKLMQISGKWSDKSIHACGILEDGSAMCWGANDRGQGPSSRRAPNGRTYTSIAVGDGFSCGLLDSGAGECWGAAPASSLKPQCGAKLVQLSGASAFGNAEVHATCRHLWHACFACT